jgi:phage-related baseplate assembly protein
LALPEPDFIPRDPAALAAEAVSAFEAETGRTLQPAQIERLVINQIAYRETLTRIAAQEVGKQALVNYATYPVLDELGVLVGVTRLPIQPALATVTFSASAVLSIDVVVPAGTRVSTADGKTVFATSADATILAGQASVDAGVEAVVAGVAGNGFAPGTLTKIVDPVGFVVSVTNITETNGGADIESDDQLRARIKLAPNTFSVAGPLKLYVSLARNAHQDIVSVVALSPVPGDIDIHVLTSSGPPSAEIKALVEAAVDSDQTRPHGDQVRVLDPVAVSYAVTANIQVTAGTDQASAISRVTAALQAVADGYAASLGAHVVLADLIAAAKAEAGVYDVQVTAPAATLALSAEQWASLTGITVTVTGVVDV